MRLDTRRASATAAATIVIALLCAAAPTRAAPAEEQPVASPASHVDVTAGWTIALPMSGGVVDAGFEPRLLQGGTLLESVSQQRLAVDTGAGYGVELALDAFPHRIAGLHIGFSTAPASLGGANGEYRTSIRYVSRQPPDYQPAEHLASQASPWDATSGRLRRSALTLGGVARLAPGRRVGGTLRVGVDWERYSGDIQSLAYTQFVMGGHATLFAVSHRVRMSPAEGQTFVRPHVGGDLHVTISRHMALVGGARVTFGPSRQIRTTPAALVDPTENAFAPDLAQVRATMGEPVLDLPGPCWRLLMGVKLLGG